MASAVWPRFSPFVLNAFAAAEVNATASIKKTSTLTLTTFKTSSKVRAHKHGGPPFRAPITRQSMEGKRFLSANSLNAVRRNAAILSL